MTVKIPVRLGRSKPVIQVKESDVQKCITDWLSAKGILAFRMNTGAVKAEGRFFRFGTPGMADVLAFWEHEIWPKSDVVAWTITPVWIECKSSTGRQSPEQKAFMQMVRMKMHKYILAYSLEDVLQVLK